MAGSCRIKFHPWQDSAPERDSETHALKPTTTDQVLDLLDASFPSASLAAALELGLFWLIDEQPLSADTIAAKLDIPPGRCRYWLQMLERAGLLEQATDGYGPTAVARSAIIDAFDRDSWVHLAVEARGLSTWLRDLALHLHQPGSARTALGLERNDYLARMADDPALALRFTRMLRDFHRPMAEELASMLEMNSVTRMMDLGGGSGVFSLALLRRHPQLSSVVVDIPVVCRAAQELAGDGDVVSRISWHEADFLEDDLPSGFDLVLECDVDVYGVELFRRVRPLLNPGGRMVIVDQLAPATGVAPRTRMHWAFQHSLDDPEFAFPTAEELEEQLTAAGFTTITRRELTFTTGPARRFTDGMVMIEATG